MLANIKNGKLVAFFLGLAGVTAVMIIGVNTLLKFASTDENPPSKTVLPIENRYETGGNSTPYYRIVEPPADDPRAITYTAIGFSPSEVTIDSSDPMGCLITVINKTAQSIRVGVNPHNPQGDPGVNYGQIKPGETAILDVRYPGLTDIWLHSHPDTTHQFRVIYAQTCQ